MCLGEGKAEDVLLGEQAAHVPRVFTARIDVGSAGRDLLLRQLPDQVDQVLVLCRDLGDPGHAACGKPPARLTEPGKLLRRLLAERRVIEHDLVLPGGVGDQHRPLALLDRFPGDDALLYVAA